MDDLSICKRIAEIEGVEVVYSKTYDIQRIAELKPYYKSKAYDDVSRNIAIEAEYFKHNEYSPLTDDGLCFRLIQKHKIWRWSHTGCGEFNVCIKGVQGWVTSVTFNKAICLAIIKANEG